MTELLPQGTSTWPSSFMAGLHAALRRRIPPRADGPALEELSRDLVLALEQQGRGIPLQPSTGLGSCQPLRRQRHRQLPLLQGQHQIATERLQLRSIGLGRNPPPQSGMEAGREAGGPSAGSLGLGEQIRHAGTSPRARSRAAMRLSGTGSMMRPGPTAFSGEAVTAPGIPRRKQ